jgi:hypothetical protein
MIGKNITAALLLAAVLGGRASRLGAQVAPADSARIVATTRALVDAITPGDTVPWARALANDWFLTDEAGSRLSRAEFLEGLGPLPAGQSGTLTMANWHLTGSGPVVVITYDIDEEHHYYGQRLQTRFHSTDTWVRRGGRWWQIASQALALPRVVAGVSIADSLARQYAGNYRLTPEIALSIVPDDSGLALVRKGRPAQRLRALDATIFVRDNVRGFWVFERDSTGAVDRLVNWRDNNPVVWERGR